MPADGEKDSFVAIAERLRGVPPEQLACALGGVGISTEQIMQALDTIERQRDDERWRQNITDMIEALARIESDNDSNIVGWNKDLALAAENILKQAPSRERANRDGFASELLLAAGVIYSTYEMAIHDEFDATLTNTAGISEEWLIKHYDNNAWDWEDFVSQPMRQLRQRLAREGWKFRELNEDGLYEDETDDY